MSVPAVPPSPIRPIRRPPGLWRLLSLPLLIFFALPIVALFLRAEPEELLASLRDEQVGQAIGLSLRTTLITVALTIMLGTPVAQLLSRPHIRFHRAIDTLVDLPTVLPPSVAGIALLLTFGRLGLLGGALEAAGIRIAFTPLAVVMAQMFVAAPFYIKSAAIGFAGVDAELKSAAMIDGANAWQVFRSVVVPLSWTALVSGSVLTWARALGEFGATILFAGNLVGRTQTMPLAIYLGLERDLGVALALSALLLVVSVLLLVALRRLEKASVTT